MLDLLNDYVYSATLQRMAPKVLQHALVMPHLEAYLDYELRRPL